MKTQDYIAIGAAVVLGGFALTALKPKTEKGVALNKSIILSTIRFQYRGNKAKLYINWGLRLRGGLFGSHLEGGAGLIGGLFASGGPIEVEESATFSPYFVRGSNLALKPSLKLDSTFVQPGSYDTIVWLSLAIPSAFPPLVIAEKIDDINLVVKA